MDSVYQQVRRQTYEGLARIDQRLEVSSVFANRRNVVLMYHSVGEPSRFGNVSPSRLRRDLEYVDERFTVVDLPAVLSNPTIGPKRVAITFDDGYRSFYRHAFPIVRDLEVPVTVFIPVGLVDKDTTFSYRLSYSPDAFENFNVVSPAFDQSDPPRLMTSDQLETLVTSDQVTLGNHTRTHPDLSAITDRQTLADEIGSARDTLESNFDITVDRLCFPYGRYNRDVLEVVRESHDFAVTTRPRPVGDDPDPHRIPRLTAHLSESALRWDLSGLRWRLSDYFGSIDYGDDREPYWNEGD